MNLSEALNAFALALEADQRTDSTVRWYVSVLKDYVSQHGSKLVTDITVEDNRRFIVEYRRRDARYVGASQQPEKRGGPSDASVSALVRALNGFWNWCEREELISRTPMKGIRNNPVRKRAPRAVAESDIIRIFDTCEDDTEGYRDRALMAVTAADQPLTRAAIARAIDRTKTPHLIGMINELSAAGRIAEIGRINKRGVLEFVYWIERRR